MSIINIRVSVISIFLLLLCKTRDLYAQKLQGLYIQKTIDIEGEMKYYFFTDTGFVFFKRHMREFPGDPHYELNEFGQGRYTMHKGIVNLTFNPPTLLPSFYSKDSLVSSFSSVPDSFIHIRLRLHYITDTCKGSNIYVEGGKMQRSFQLKNNQVEATLPGSFVIQTLKLFALCYAARDLPYHPQYNFFTYDLYLRQSHLLIDRTPPGTVTLYLSRLTSQKKIKGIEQLYPASAEIVSNLKSLTSKYTALQELLQYLRL